MYTVEEMMKMLEANSDADLAAEFTKVLNEAKSKNEEKRRAEELKAQKEKEKMLRANELAAAINKFLSEYYEELGENTFSGKEIVAMLDNARSLTHSFKTFMPKAKMAKNADDILEDFLRSFNL